ncbi:MAG: YceI family protein [Flavobacteriales bacterium]|nr:YceI family protein [Flavobacteriales bacterium]
MKKAGLFFMAVGALSLTACSSSTEEETNVEEVEAVTYTLDKENTTLGWAASMSPEYGHEGTVEFESGSITMKGDELTDGSFVVDMTTIKSTDLPEDKAAVLKGHLQGTMVDEDHPQDMFFNTPEYPTVEVKLGDYKDGKLNITLMILGSEISEVVPVEISSDENGATIKGEFAVNFASLNMPGLAPSENGAIGPDFKFDLNAALTK